MNEIPTWPKILNDAVVNGMSPMEKEKRFEIAFLEYHKNAEEIVFGKNGKVILAIYLTPQAYHRLEIKELIEQLKNAYLMEHEK